MSLTRYAVRRPVSTVSASLAIVLLGSVALSRVPVSLLPDVQLPILTIRTSYPGAAAPEVSRFVAEPIELAVAGTAGLVDLRSVSRNGQSTTTMRFAWGVDMKRTILLVRERLDNARSSLPFNADRPTLLASELGERPIAVIALSTQDDLRSLARAAEDVYVRRLEQLEGVARVAVVGSPRDEIRIELDPLRLGAYSLSMQDIAFAVRGANVATPGGTVRRGQFRLPVQAQTELKSLEDIGSIPVGSARSLELRDLGEIALTQAPTLSMSRYNLKQAIGLVVYKDIDANTVAVTSDLSALVNDLAREQPRIGIAIVASQARFVKAALSNLGQEIVLGGTLAMLVILLFLRSLRASLAIAAVVPLSVLLSVVILQTANVTVNLLSLGGLALAIGLLVDNAIVVVEAARRSAEETGLSDAETTIIATEEVAGPLIAGTLTTVLVFAPVIFLRGLASALFRDLSLSVASTLIGSLLLALTLVPVIVASGSSRYAHNQESNKLTLKRNRIKARAIEGHERFVLWTVIHGRYVLLAIGIAIAVAVPLVLRIPREILPQVDEGTVVATLRLPEGTAIQETSRQVSRIESAAREFGAPAIYARIGIATNEEILAGIDYGSSATAQLLLTCPSGVSASQMASNIRARLPDLARGPLALDVAGQTDFGGLIGREGRLVRVEVAAPSPLEAQRWADSAAFVLRQLDELSDVRTPYATTQPALAVQLKRDLIAERGLTVAMVADALSGALGGNTVSELRQTDRRTPILVSLSRNSNERLSAALSVRVDGTPVGQLVSYEETRIPVEVVRSGQRPIAVVEALIERGGTDQAARSVGEAMRELNAPASIALSVTGADEEQRRTTKELVTIALLSVALIYLVLAAEFASFTLPALVMICVPLAGIGGLVLLWIIGQNISAVSLIGIIVTIGMADNEAVVKLDAVRRFRLQGHSAIDAVLLGGRQRSRAIMMTSLTTIVGVLPLAFGIGSGGALYQPLAATVIGGSVATLVVTFYILPAAYVLLEGRSDPVSEVNANVELTIVRPPIPPNT